MVKMIILKYERKNILQNLNVLEMIQHIHTLNTIIVLYCATLYTSAGWRNGSLII